MRTLSCLWPGSFYFMLISCLTIKPKNVKVFHFLNVYWGDLYSGDQNCVNLNCEFFNDQDLVNLSAAFYSQQQKSSTNVISVSLYSIHHLIYQTAKKIPNRCLLNTTYSIAESLESHQRFSNLFKTSFHNFDGFSTVSPKATIPRVYNDAFLNSTTFLPLIPYESLIKGASYVVSHCRAPSGRDKLVQKLRTAGLFRVDGLGTCLRTNNYQIRELAIGRLNVSDKANYQRKLTAISRYMFHIASENTIEPGYVTEKIFHALIAGTVPVYLGAARDCKELLPHPKAAVFVDDFDNNATELGMYLNFLISNKTAYEEHRVWRYGFSEERHISRTPMLSSSWPCRVCQWAANESNHASRSSYAEDCKANNARTDGY